MGSLSKFLGDLNIVLTAGITSAAADGSFESASDNMELVNRALKETTDVMKNTGKRWNRIANDELEDIRYEVSKAAREIKQGEENARLAARFGENDADTEWCGECEANLTAGESHDSECSEYEADESDESELEARDDDSFGACGGDGAGLADECEVEPSDESRMEPSN